MRIEESTSDTLQ